ncbi:MAG: PEGA domain-containing protein [Myxococcota bacterium]|nr:PEGA domain-containing protein [Myxococcota bacterium]
MFVLVGRVIITNPQATQFNKRHCERCADDRLQSEATTLVAEMLRQLASQSGRTVVDIKSDPAGAQIVLDGQRIGVTNSTFNTFPGKHVVVLEKSGYLRETHEFVIEEGKTADVSLTLRASDVQTPETPVTHRSRLVPGVVVGVGAAAVMGGAILYIVDEDQSPTGGKKYFDSAPAGVAIGIAGLVTVGAGAYLWRRASRSSSTPSAGVVRGGAIIGWSGAF